MKKIFSAIVITLICFVSFSQTFEWKRLSDDVVDSVYQQAVFTTNDIVLKNQNYYFAYSIFPYESEWGGPSVFRRGYLYPTILSQDNQIIMADTLDLDSIFFSKNIATTFIQNDTFRVIINYPFLDSATYQDNVIIRKGIPVPKTDGFLLINYSLDGSFLGYDSISLPEPISHFSNRAEQLNQNIRRPIVSKVMVNSYGEVFFFIRNNLSESSVSWTTPVMDTIGFIMKCNSSLIPDSKVISILKSTVSGGDGDKMDICIHNDNMTILGDIGPSVIVDNILFTPDSDAGLHTFALEFDRNLFVLQNHKLPGEYNNFTIDENGHFFTLGRFNYPVFINPDSIIPKKVYVTSIDSFVYWNFGLINKLDGNFNSMYYSYFTIPYISNSVFAANGNRVFIKNFFNGYDTLVDDYPGNNGKTNLSLNYDTIAGMFYFKNGDSLVSTLIHHFSDNLVLINSDNLVPSWDYNFPLDNNVMNIYFNSDNMLLNFSAYYYYLSGFGDTDTLFLSGYYYPVVLAQISITGLGLEEMAGSDAAPLVVYPNPASDKLFLKLPENSGFIVSVYDLSGKLQVCKKLSGGENDLNVSALNSGIYIIRAQNEKQILVGKFLKE